MHTAPRYKPDIKLYAQYKTDAQRAAIAFWPVPAHPWSRASPFGDANVSLLPASSMLQSIVPHAAIYFVGNAELIENEVVG